MCGICGFVSRQEMSLEQLEAMNKSMRHRGPDDHGAEIAPIANGYFLGLAQRRLSVIDLTEKGHQPMHSPDGRISLVFNGEIYNFRELKKELGDYAYESTSDTEVIIAAYLKWGIDCVKRFNGMFVFALFDREEDAFYLVRDRIGKKPIYYQNELNNLYFASELKPMMLVPGFKREVRKEIISRYLYHQYICHPDSIFTGVQKLPPGSYLRMDTSGRGALSMEVRKYWDISSLYHRSRENLVKNYKQGREELIGLLKNAVSSRMYADVPVGVFLSGGFDSSLVAALASGLSDEPIKTFSIGFDEESHNEAEYARAVAEHLGTKHTEAIITEDEMLALVESIPHYFDEPFADASQIPMMLVSDLARREVTVVLSGDGGDEFFCGYNVYEKVYMAQLLDKPGALLHGLLNLPLIDRLELERRLPFAARTITANRHPDIKVQFGGAGYARMAEDLVSVPNAIRANYHFENKYGVRNWQIRRMLLDMDTYLPGDILAKVDRATMKYSLEARCPLLDKDVMEYSFRLDHSFKYRHGVKKRIIKNIAYDYIPRELLDRPKTGFAPPIDVWLRGPLREQLTDLVNESYLKKQGIFEVDETVNLVEKYLCTGDKGPSSGANYSLLVWPLFIFQKWWERYIH
ncbi:MAG: asparagine synthase (glutamine-hydrolyzing) [Lachnospiraceae bacterium]|nr:asparagine synthase (glutamine-hydrolyzing) [Lachnospiraceae bacterium]